MTITVVFDPPLPSDSPATFNTKAFTLLGDLNTWSTQANAMPASFASSVSAALAAPPAIGGTTPAAGSFTALSASGNVGVGAASSGSRLEVTAPTNDGMKLTDGTTTAILFASGHRANSLVFGSTTNVPVSFFQNNAEAFYVDVNKNLLATSGGLGYGVGAGGTATQATNRNTNVAAINKGTGNITLCSAAGSTTPFSFTVPNSLVTADDGVHVCQKSGTDKYVLLVTNVTTGSFVITGYTTGGTTTEQPVIKFTVLKGAAT